MYRFGRFYTLYDFAADVGDVWEITGYPTFEIPCDTTGFVEVESISDTLINGIFLKVINTIPINGTNWYYPQKIIENIGPLSYILPNNYNCSINYEEASILRCYEDSTIGLFSTDVVESCTYLTTRIGESQQFSGIRLYPNPASSLIRVDLKSNNFKGRKINYKILDTSDRLLTQGSLTELNAEINISDFEAGYYILLIDNSPHKTIYQKFIKL